MSDVDVTIVGGGCLVAPYPNVSLRVETGTTCVTVEGGVAVAVRGGARVHLTNLEARLVAFLISHPDRAWSRSELLGLVWEHVPRKGMRTVTVHVCRVRAKLGASLIVTVARGRYRLGVRVENGTVAV